MTAAPGSTSWGCISGCMLLISVVDDPAALTHAVCMVAHASAWSAKWLPSIPALLAKHASAPETSITSKVLGQAKQGLFCNFPAVHPPDAATHWHVQEKAQELSTPSLGRLVRDPALLDEGVMLVDSCDAHWPIVYANTAAAKLAGGAC